MNEQIWLSEPDEWEAEMCYALRHPSFGHWCGYLGVPKGHPWWGVRYDELDPHPEVHGGITYSEDHKPRQEPDGLWWLGFDCGHLNDYQPLAAEVYPELELFTGGEYRSLEYVKLQIRDLMRQAVQAQSQVIGHDDRWARP
jgi:hypothetical protein